MSKIVFVIRLCGNKISARINKTFSDYHDAVTIFGSGGLYVGNEFFDRESNLRHQDDMRRIFWVSFALGEACSCGDPACIASHHFDDGNERRAKTHRLVIKCHFAHYCRDVLNDAPISRAVVGDRQIIVHRFRDPNRAQVISAFLREQVHLVGSILRVIAANIKEIANVVRLKHLQNTIKVFLLFDLVATRTEG